MKIECCQIKSWIFILCFFLYFGQLSVAQEKTKNPKELHLQLNNLSNLDFSLNYKIVKSETFAWTFGLADIFYNMSAHYPSVSSSFPTRSHVFSAAFKTGPEFRKPIIDKLMFYHGPSILLGVNLINNTVKNPALPIAAQREFDVMYKIGLPYVFGLQYQVLKQFALAVELAPAVIYQYAPDEASDSHFLTFSANNYAKISLVYNF